MCQPYKLEPIGKKLPSNFPEVLGATLRRLPSKEIEDRAGVRKNIAARMLRDTIAKFVQNADGTLALPNTLTKTELGLVNVLAGTLTSSVAFSAERLYEDFTATLKSHGLITKLELHEFARLGPALSLFAVTVMHNCAVRLQDGTTTKLRASTDPAAGAKIDVSAFVPTPHPNGGEVFIASAMFATELDGVPHCDPALLAIPRPWDFDLELTAQGTLAKLG